MRVSFWGVRGSIPVADHATLGHTTAWTVYSLGKELGRSETARDLEGTPDRYAASVRRLVEQVLAET